MSRPPGFVVALLVACLALATVAPVRAVDAAVVPTGVESSPTPAATPTGTPVESATPGPTSTPPPSPTATPADTPTPTPADTPTATPSSTPSPVPTPVPDPLCGTTVSGTLVLSGDVENCPRVGLVLGSGAVLDCAGHSITGAVGGDQETWGVLLSGAVGAEVRNCRVTGFGRGIRVDGGSANRIVDDVTPANLRYGIELAGATTGNLVGGNLVEDSGDEGIHVGTGADDNQVNGNTVRRSAAENLYVLSSSGTVATGNVLESPGPGKASLFVKNSPGGTYSGNRVEGLVHLRGDSHHNSFAATESTGRGFRLEGWQENGGPWGFPHDNDFEGGTISGADVCFAFVGAHHNTAAHVVARGCTPVESSSVGGQDPVGNVVQICGDGVLAGDESCDAGSSNGAASTCCSEACAVTAGVVCRPAASECDAAEACDGLSGSCPADGFATAGTACTADGLPCSNDVCNGSGACTHPPSAAGTVCRPAVGECDAPEACNGSSRTCPSDKLAVSGFVCRASAGACDFAEKCNGASPSCPADALRPAGTVCRASAGACDVAESCDGAVATCPDDALRPADFVCRPAADPCDFQERCDGTDSACPADASKPDGRRCSDENACTSGDVCVAGVCTGSPVSCEACETCDPSVGCAPGLRAACAQARPGGSRLLLVDRRNDALDSLLWKWTADAGVAAADFGDPTTAEDYALCVFDQSGGAARLVLRANALAGGDCGGAPCWETTDTGFQYRDPIALPDGLEAFKLDADAGAGILRVTGLGANLPMPVLPLVPPIVVQAVSTSGPCWQATFSAPEANRKIKLRAFSD